MKKGCEGYWRFCFQCGKLEALSEFEGTKGEFQTGSQKSCCFARMWVDDSMQVGASLLLKIQPAYHLVICVPSISLGPVRYVSTTQQHI